jgi:serine/threonine protein kinase
VAPKQPGKEQAFSVAAEIQDPAERAAYLDEACGGDAAMRAEIEQLLAHDAEEDSLLDRSAAGLGPTIDQPVSEKPGTQIGPYKLMEQIGEGGMGVVFVAEQERPVRRKVALKIVKPGMDTKEVVARFEAERQALALMDHPNIAKVFDAGSTESGRPYFVMELVRGIPVTDYCDQGKLTVKERLDLFIQICQAVQHAHQKGIIHRDIKPSNVLVTLHDGKPVPKVIDFGVAKAMHQRLTERTIYTRFAQIIGTPMYMSPEQAELSGLDIDTRSDIYSLGVLLYELVTGTTPFDKKRFAEAAYDEIRRVIREEEPSKPSTKVRTLGETITSVAAHRGTDARGLSRFLMGDLDVIVMKALEKERHRRYDTATGLAEDVERFLKNEPIEARSPSVSYRFRKFARRNRVAVVTVGLVVATLIAGIITTGWMAHVAQVQAREARRQRGIAETANRRLNEEIRQKNDLFEELADAFYGEAVAAALGGDQEKAKEALKLAKDAGASLHHIQVLEALIVFNSGRFDEAARLTEQLLNDESVEGSDRIGALSLYIAASQWGGYGDRAALRLIELSDLTPATETDHLLMALAMAGFAPKGALTILHGSPRHEHSAPGLFIRAIAKYIDARDKGNAQQMGEALVDFQYVQDLFRDDLATMCWRGLALAAAIEFARRDGRDEDVAAYTKLAGPLLKQPWDYPPVEYCRWILYRAIGDEKHAASTLRRLGRSPGSYCCFLAADCLRRQDWQAAAREFDAAIAPEDKQSKWVRIALGRLACKSPGGAKKVRDLVGDLVDDPSPIISVEALTTLCLVSDAEEIRERAKRASANISRFKTTRFIASAGVDFFAGDLSEQQLLEEAGQRKLIKSSAHFMIAMMRLAEGKRDEAYEHFQMAKATRISGWPEWSAAFLARMDADPTLGTRIQKNGAK